MKPLIPALEAIAFKKEIKPSIPISISDIVTPEVEVLGQEGIMVPIVKFVNLNSE